MFEFVVNGKKYKVIPANGRFNIHYTVNSGPDAGGKGFASFEDMETVHDFMIINSAC